MSDSVIKSLQSEVVWVEQIFKALQMEIILDVDDTPSVFRVPKTLRDTKPEAYAPQQLGLGLYHHLRPEFHNLQKQKVAAVRKFLTPEQLENFQELVHNQMLGFEALIRRCYNEYFDITGTTIAVILSIDGIYLLHILETYLNNSVSPQMAELIILENQIPSYVLNAIRSSLNHIDGHPMMFTLYLDYCRKHSPLVLTKKQEFTHRTNSHLLAYMYHLIVNNHINEEDGGFLIPKVRTCIEDIVSIVNIGAEYNIAGAQTIQRHIKFIQSLPLQRFAGAFKKKEETDENKPVVEEIDIPSVSELHEIAKVQFRVATGGIRNVTYDETERIFYLPVITLTFDSDIVLRNLVAYETAAIATGESGSRELANYVDLMCGIVDTVKDVVFLREAGIIEGDLPDKEIADIFNGISKSTANNSDFKSELEKAVDTVNVQYENSFRVKATKFLKKHMNISWKFISVFTSIVLMILLVLQSFCQIYGCKEHWFKLGAPYSDM